MTKFIGRSLLMIFAWGSVAVAVAQTKALPPVLPVTVLKQGPADTKTDLQIICLFRSSPVNQLHGALIETDEKLSGLLKKIRQPGRFDGLLGETLLITPHTGAVGAKRILVIGLGDSQTFTPERMYLVGKIALLEADRLKVAHPYFAPTVIDGGISTFTTGDVAVEVVHGFRDALGLLQDVNKHGQGEAPSVQDFTYLAGMKFASSTQEGIERALQSK